MDPDYGRQVVFSAAWKLNAWLGSDSDVDDSDVMGSDDFEYYYYYYEACRFGSGLRAPLGLGYRWTGLPLPLHWFSYHDLHSLPPTGAR